MRLVDPPPEVHAFTNIAEGIRDFSEVTGVKVDKLPTPERIEEIKKEQEELPPLGWMQTNDAASIAVRNAHLHHRGAAFLAAITSSWSGWHPGMMEPERAMTTAPPPQVPPEDEAE
jgi:hypothetical protein